MCIAIFLVYWNTALDDILWLIECLTTSCASTHSSYCIYSIRISTGILCVFRGDLAYFDGLSEVILTAGLVVPKPGIFQEHIRFLLVLTTPVDIVILGVSFASMYRDPMCVCVCVCVSFSNYLRSCWIRLFWWNAPTAGATVCHTIRQYQPAQHCWITSWKNICSWERWLPLWNSIPGRGWMVQPEMSQGQPFNLKTVISSAIIFVFLWRRYLNQLYASLEVSLCTLYLTFAVYLVAILLYCLCTLYCFVHLVLKKGLKYYLYCKVFSSHSSVVSLP